MTTHVDPVPREARPYQGKRAGIVSRTTANVIDVVIVVVFVISVWLGWAALRFLFDPRNFEMPMPPRGFVLVIGYVTFALYLGVSWATAGRSIGGGLMGLRVVNFRGEQLRPAGALLRGAFCAIFPLGLLWVVVSRENRAVQDLVLRTSVIYDWDVHRRPRESR